MWVIATLAGLAGFIVLILCVPLDTTLSLDTSRIPKFRLRLVWLFGILSKELHKEKRKPKKQIPEEKPKRKRRIELGTILKIIRSKGLLRQIRDLVRDVLGQLKIKELIANLRLGTGDPADDGLMFAVIGSTTPFLNLPPQYHIRVQPSFYDEAIFEGHLHGVLRVWPIRLVWPLLRFLFSLAIFRVITILISSKWKRRK